MHNESSSGIGWPSLFEKLFSGLPQGGGWRRPLRQTAACGSAETGSSAGKMGRTTADYLLPVSTRNPSSRMPSVARLTTGMNGQVCWPRKKVCSAAMERSLAAI